MNSFRNLFLGIVAVSGVAVFANGDFPEFPDPDMVDMPVVASEGPKKGENSSGDTKEVAVKLATDLVVDVAVKEEIENGFLSKLGRHLSSLLYLPVACVDKVAEKVWINSMVNRIGQFSFLPNKIGGLLIKHEKGLSRSIVVAIVGCTGYYAWKKYKKSEQEAKRFRQECCDFDQENFNEKSWDDLFDNNEDGVKKTDDESLINDQSSFNDEQEDNVAIID